MVDKVFDKNTSGGTAKNEIISNTELAKELPSLIIKFEKRQIYAIIDNMCS